MLSLALGDPNFSCHLKQNPQRESVEYRFRWVSNAKSSQWPCTFHAVCVNFICVRWPMQTQFSVKYGLKNMSHKLFNFSLSLRARCRGVKIHKKILNTANGLLSALEWLQEAFQAQNLPLTPLCNTDLMVFHTKTLITLVT